MKPDKTSKRPSFVDVANEARDKIAFDILNELRKCVVNNVLIVSFKSVENIVEQLATHR